MLLNEARWLRAALQDIPTSELSPLLNLGSSTGLFREIEQPYIDSEIFAPLRARGIEVVHCDLKQAEGVDVACDIYSEKMLEAKSHIGPRAVLCSNMLEHVASREAMVRRLGELLPPGGLLVLTVPRSYPYHADPIDNRFRPDLPELAGLFDGWTRLNGAIVADETFAETIRRAPMSGLRNLFRAVVPWPRPQKWLGALHRWTWLFRPYAVTCLVLRKPIAP